MSIHTFVVASAAIALGAQAPAQSPTASPAAPRRAEAPAAQAPAPSDHSWRKTKIHVGKHKGLTLGDLDRASVESLVDRWLPTATAAPKKSADDKRLIAALEAAVAELAAEAEDNIPMGNQPY